MENGNCAIVDNLKYNIGFGSTEFIVIRHNPKIIDLNYLYLILRNKNFRKVFELNMKGSAGQQRVSPDYLSNFKIPLPLLSEQKKIVSYVATKQSEINNIVAKTTKEIELIKEYKLSLISEAVSGKIKV